MKLLNWYSLIKKCLENYTYLCGSRSIKNFADKIQHLASNELKDAGLFESFKYKVDASRCKQYET